MKQLAAASSPSRRRRTEARLGCASTGASACTGFFGLITMVCLASLPPLTSALVPSKINRRTAPPTVTREYLDWNSEASPSLDFFVPIEWLDTTDGNNNNNNILEGEMRTSLQTRRRQYSPSSTKRTRVVDGRALHSHWEASSAPSSSNGSPPNTNNEFELHVGKALDTLRRDYPRILTNLPDMSIYDQNIELVDPSGVRVHGLKTYSNTFRLLHALVKFLYCPGRSSMSFRMCFDKARRNIRIHWNVAVVPREIFGGSRTTKHVDGISVYELDLDTGSIVQHRIEQLLINNMPIRPKEGVVAALRDEHRVTVPSFCQQPDTIVRFEPAGWNFMQLPTNQQGVTSLFAMEASESSKEKGSERNDNGSTESVDADAGPSQIVTEPVFDQERFEAKNKSRKKFGLKPLTEEEFMAIELEVQRLDSEVKQRQQQAAAAAAANRQEKSSGPSFLEKLFGNVLKDTCESNWDCERPEVCCDFGFKKMCCSSGSLVANGLPPQPALVPVPVDVGDPRNPDPRNF